MYVCTLLRKASTPQHYCRTCNTPCWESWESQPGWKIPLEDSMPKRRKRTRKRIVMMACLAVFICKKVAAKPPLTKYLPPPPWKGDGRRMGRAFRSAKVHCFTMSLCLSWFKTLNYWDDREKFYTNDLRCRDECIFARNWQIGNSLLTRSHINSRQKLEKKRRWQKWREIYRFPSVWESMSRTEERGKNCMPNLSSSSLSARNKQTFPLTFFRRKKKLERREQKKTFFLRPPTGQHDQYRFCSVYCLDNRPPPSSLPSLDLSWGQRPSFLSTNPKGKKETRQFPDNPWHPMSSFLGRAEKDLSWAAETFVPWPPTRERLALSPPPSPLPPRPEERFASFYPTYQIEFKSAWPHLRRKSS